MKSTAFRHTTSDSLELFVYRWLPDPGPPRAVVQIAHGMGEHAGRYEEAARHLTAAGYAVYAADQRGHGRTADGPLELGHLASRDGWNQAVRDLRDLNRRVEHELPGAQRVLLGHSMGSLLARQYLLDHGSSLAAAVLSGSSGGAGWRRAAALWVARLERWRLGERAASPLLQRLIFGGFNRGFAGRTDFDWLSRDEAEVDRYIADPHCGFVLRTQGICDMLRALGRLEDPAELVRIPRALPVYVVSGSEDPVGGKLEGVRKLLADFEAAGLRRVEHRFYAGARHELFHEINRAEVCDDLTRWLDGALAA